MLLQAFDSTGEQLLYGILLVIVYSVVLDKCLMLGTAKMQIKVVSEKIDEIRKAVLTDIDRGVTMLKSETGYMERETRDAAYGGVNTGTGEDGEADPFGG